MSRSICQFIPTRHERELQDAARLLVYLRKRCGIVPEAWAVQEAKNIYAKDERSTQTLYEALASMSPQERDRVVSDARDPVARDLGDWWKYHHGVCAFAEIKDAAMHRRAEHSSASLGFTLG